MNCWFSRAPDLRTIYVMSIPPFQPKQIPAHSIKVTAGSELHVTVLFDAGLYIFLRQNIVQYINQCKK